MCFAMSFSRIISTIVRSSSVVSNTNTKCTLFYTSIGACRSVKTMASDCNQIESMIRKLAPSMDEKRYKGQSGRIAIFGGSLEYTGAPYFSAISALKVGADLVHVFCPKDAGLVIKTYSPELIVHPLLDDNDAINKILPWMDRFHVIVIGPGLGRENSTFETIDKIFELCRKKQKPLVVDADALFYIAKDSSKLNNYPAPGAILTPNKMEYARLLGSDNPSCPDESKLKELLGNWGPNVTILVKGEEDKIINQNEQVWVPKGGSGRRCGGQGDILGGALATFFAWTLPQNKNMHSVAAYAACKLTKECNSRMFKKKGRSMVATDMIEEIHGAFQDFFELKE